MSPECGTRLAPMKNFGKLGPPDQVEMTFPSVNWGNKSDKKDAKQLPVLHYKSCKRLPNGRRSTFSQNSDRPLHPLVSTALAGLNNSLLSYHSNSLVSKEKRYKSFDWHFDCS